MKQNKTNPFANSSALLGLGQDRWPHLWSHVCFSLHRKSDSASTSGGSKSQSRSRSRSDSPPRQVHRGAPYKGSEVRTSRKSKDCKYLTQKPHKSRSRSSSRSRSRSRERTDNSGKYKKKSHYYRDQRRERSRSYERTGHRYERDHPAHSRHRR